ncbi:hypothetical protein BG20_I2506 [Candidatus Nitrosarchaeum limnium BG20]|uniref:Uncharacterized protein n=1 Tax=Candidatus Nitrosarchaeum limnium BG20 TaxID=859192 RepID=S2ENQ9_9ARCH|nr:hypothetical protein BG20_I2506 [Candidatus Nitrosarchaeum limnium BG20]
MITNKLQIIEEIIHYVDLVLIITLGGILAGGILTVRWYISK